LNNIEVDFSETEEEYVGSRHNFLKLRSSGGFW